MIRALVPALALACVASPALADTRIATVFYDEARIVRIDGKTTVQASIVFGKDETIENVAIGDSQAWQVTPNKRADILFVKPMAPRASTNMTVITNKRTYLFDLVANPAARAVYVLRFDYPAEPEPAKAPEQLAANADVAIAPEQGVDPLDLNFAWTGSGEAALLPTRSFDDGEATYLTWPEGRDVPAILITNSEGVEGPVNFTVRGETVVVDGVPRSIVLRSGKKSATLVNAGPERPTSAASQSGTALAANREIK